MKRSERLTVVLNLYQRHEDEAAAVLQQRQQHLAEQEKQLDQLINYQQDYQNRLGDSAQQGVSMAQWRRTQDYVEQLNGIIKQQEQQVRLADADVQSAERRWQQAHLDRKSMDSAVARIEAEEEREAERREQKVNDDLVQQMLQRRR